MTHKQLHTIVTDDLYNLLSRTSSRAAIEKLVFEIFTRLSSQSGADAKSVKPQTIHFCRALLAPYPFMARREMMANMVPGLSLTRLVRHQLAPAAENIWGDWQGNRIPFDQMARAMLRLYAIIDSLRRIVPSQPEAPPQSLAFVPMPAGRLSNRAAGVVDALETTGWDVSVWEGQSHETIVNAISPGKCRWAVLTAPGRRQRTALLRLIIALRIVQPDVNIMVSGGVVNDDPGLIGQAGVDMTVQDVDEIRARISDLPKRQF